jgi:hypothetical protein
MAARHIEEACDIGLKFPAFVAFPGKPAGQPELAAKADGAHGTNFNRHIRLP